MSQTTNMGINLINPSDYVDPSAINEGFEALDALGVDYVIESGQSGIWTYRKWKSGYAEVEAMKTFADSTMSSWANGWYISQPYTFGTYPITFKSEPLVNINFVRSSSNGYGAMVHIRGANSGSYLTNCPNFSLADPTESTYSSPKMAIRATGYYK